MPPSARSSIEISIVGDDKGVQRLLRRMDTGFSSIAMAGFLATAVGPWLQQRAQDRFENEGDDVVGKWKPLALSTQQIRAAGPWNVGPAHPINVRTRELEDYVTGGRGAALPLGPIAQLTFPDPARVKSHWVVEKMQTAQKGRNKPHKTPPRPVVGLGVQDLAFVIASLNFYTERLVGRLSR